MADHDTHDHTGIPGISSGSVATDAIWDAAGDLAVGTGADTAARVAIGAAGGAVSRLNGVVAWNSGTSFPGSKATGDRYWRTDLGMEFYWDGTRWLTTNVLIYSSGGAPVASVAATGGGYLRTSIGDGVLDIWLEKIVFTMYSSSLSGSAYWTVLCEKVTAADSPTSLGTANDLSGTNATYERKTLTINAALGSFVILQWTVTKTSTPGVLTVTAPIIYCRLIGT